MDRLYVFILFMWFRRLRILAKQWFREHKYTFGGLYVQPASPHEPWGLITSFFSHSSDLYPHIEGIPISLHSYASGGKTGSYKTGTPMIWLPSCTPGSEVMCPRSGTEVTYIAVWVASKPRGWSCLARRICIFLYVFSFFLFLPPLFCSLCLLRRVVEYFLRL